MCDIINYHFCIQKGSIGMIINVKSEIGPLKQVLLHRPGGELLNLTPDTLEQLLFDDIPYLKVAVEEHDEFAKILRKNGVEVVYLEDLVAETLNDENVRDMFIRQFIRESGKYSDKYQKILYDFFKQYKDPKELVLKTMQGVSRDEVTSRDRSEKSLVDYVSEKSTFVCNPMPNLYFTRDSFACIGNGVSINQMRFLTRQRETIFGEHIFKYNKRFKNKVKIYYDRYEPFHIEGGDILNLSSKAIAIGLSQRTQADAIEILSKNIFNDETSEIQKILVFDIPNNRAMMHLDTVFTQVDYDKFTVHNGLEDVLKIYCIAKNKETGIIETKQVEKSLDAILAETLQLDKVYLIPCGGNDKIVGQREQWNDGSNTLCISPGKVVVYQRNNVTNSILKEYGIEVFEMPGSELSRGRGGPRCMSMPLYRENI